MLPTLPGQFSTLACPYFEEGNCERGHCHFRHKRIKEEQEENVDVPLQPLVLEYGPTTFGTGCGTELPLESAVIEYGPTPAEVDSDIQIPLQPLVLEYGLASKGADNGDDEPLQPSVVDYGLPTGVADGGISPGDAGKEPDVSILFTGIISKGRDQQSTRNTGNDWDLGKTDPNGCDEIDLPTSPNSSVVPGNSASTTNRDDCPNSDSAAVSGPDKQPSIKSSYRQTHRSDKPHTNVEVRSQSNEETSVPAKSVARRVSFEKSASKDSTKTIKDKRVEKKEKIRSQKTRAITRRENEYLLSIQKYLLSNPSVIRRTYYYMRGIDLQNDTDVDMHSSDDHKKPSRDKDKGDKHKKKSKRKRSSTETDEAADSSKSRIKKVRREIPQTVNGELRRTSSSDEAVADTSSSHTAQKKPNKVHVDISEDNVRSQLTCMEDDAVDSTDPVEPKLAQQNSTFSKAPATKIRIAPVTNQAMLRFCKKPSPSVPFNGIKARVQHPTPESNDTTCYLPTYTVGNKFVTAAQRQISAQNIYKAFVDKKAFSCLSEAGLVTEREEEAIFKMSNGDIRTYRKKIIAVVKKITLQTYFNTPNQGKLASDAYDVLLSSALSLEDLIANGFPVLVDGKMKCTFNEEYSFNRNWKKYASAIAEGNRYCSRCHKDFEVDENGVQTVLGCSFHGKGSKTDRISGERFYSCGCYLNSPCCNTENYHVTESNVYDDMTDVQTFEDDSPDGYQKIYALDCEMVQTHEGLKLAHVIVVDYNGELAYESLCKPSGLITDYLTEYSGMTESMLSNVNKTLRDIHRDLSKIFHSDTILIGHSLDSDFRALKISHTLVVDTSLLFGVQNVNGSIRKRSLKNLMAEYVRENIQNSVNGHSALEDAAASLMLAKKKVGLI